MSGLLIQAEKEQRGVQEQPRLAHVVPPADHLESGQPQLYHRVLRALRHPLPRRGAFASARSDPVHIGDQDGAVGYLDLLEHPATFQLTGSVQLGIWLRGISRHLDLAQQASQSARCPAPSFGAAARMHAKLLVPGLCSFDLHERL